MPCPTLPRATPSACCGVMKMEYYPIEFVKRTKELLEKKYEQIREIEQLEVTFLINCLLGLIVAVVENHKKATIFKGNIDIPFADKIPDKVWYLKKNQEQKDIYKILKEAKDESTHCLIKEVSYDDFTIKTKSDLKKGYAKSDFIAKLRNAIAHQNIFVGSKDKQCETVKMWNEWNGYIDFEIEFTIEELLKLALYIAKEYLTLKRSH
jgi:hypothetical protein